MSDDRHWILTEDELPTPGEPVLVTGGHDDLFVAQWDMRMKNWRVHAPKGISGDKLKRYGWGVPKAHVYAWTPIGGDIPGKRPVDVMPFGKHKGERIEDLPANYLGWLSINMRSRPLRVAAEKELERRRQHDEESAQRN